MLSRAKFASCSVQLIEFIFISSELKNNKNQLIDLNVFFDSHKRNLCEELKQIIM